MKHFFGNHDVAYSCQTIQLEVFKVYLPSEFQYYSSEMTRKKRKKEINILILNDLEELD